MKISQKACNPFLSVKKVKRNAHSRLLVKQPLTIGLWTKLFHEWVKSHRGKNLPLLSDEAISRASIYEDRF